MINIKDVYELESLEDYINLKNEDLNKIVLSYNELIKKYKFFISSYKENIISITDFLNKKLDTIYNMIDSFKNQSNNLELELKNLSEEIVKHKYESNNNLSSIIEEKLINKLSKELDIIKLNFENIISSYLNEFEDGKKQIDKAISKLTKLKNKEL